MFDETYQEHLRRMEDKGCVAFGGEPRGEDEITEFFAHTTEGGGMGVTWIEGVTGGIQAGTIINLADAPNLVIIVKPQWLTGVAHTEGRS